MFLFYFCVIISVIVKRIFGRIPDIQQKLDIEFDIRPDDGYLSGLDIWYTPIISSPILSSIGTANVSNMLEDKKTMVHLLLLRYRMAVCIVLSISHCKVSLWQAYPALTFSLFLHTCCIFSFCSPLLRPIGTERVLDEL